MDKAGAIAIAAVGGRLVDVAARPFAALRGPTGEVEAGLASGAIAAGQPAGISSTLLVLAGTRFTGTGMTHLAFFTGRIAGVATLLGELVFRSLKSFGATSVPAITVGPTANGRTAPFAIVAIDEALVAPHRPVLGVTAPLFPQPWGAAGGRRLVLAVAFVQQAFQQVGAFAGGTSLLVLTLPALPSATIFAALLAVTLRIARALVHTEAVVTASQPVIATTQIPTPVIFVAHLPFAVGHARGLTHPFHTLPARATRTLGGRGVGAPLGETDIFGARIAVFAIDEAAGQAEPGEAVFSKGARVTVIALIIVIRNPPQRVLLRTTFPARVAGCGQPRFVALAVHAAKPPFHRQLAPNARLA